MELIERLGNSLTLDKIKAAITGVDTSKEASFFSVWQDRINFFRTNNNGEQYTTAESYECAMKSFQKILWDRPITGFKVGKEDIEYWSNGMQNGVLTSIGVVQMVVACLEDIVAVGFQLELVILERLPDEGSVEIA